MKQAICPCPQQICISSELSCFVLLVSVKSVGMGENETSKKSQKPCEVAMQIQKS